VVQVDINPMFRYSATIASWDSQEIVKLEYLWMCAFKKAWSVNVSLPDVSLGTPKARTIITSETTSLINQYMTLNNDLRQVTIHDMLQAIAYLGFSTIAEAQAELQWDGDIWQQHLSCYHQFLACTNPEVCR